MPLTTTPGYVRCAMPFGANDHCDFAAMHATIHHLIYLFVASSATISGDLR